MFHSSKIAPFIIVVTLALISTAGFGQNVLFHLLGASLPIVNFTTTAQTFSEGDGAIAAWPTTLNAWSKRRQIILNGSAGSVSNYTALLKIDSTKIDYVAAGANGQSLRFATDAGTLLPFEIESWNSSGTSFVWIKVPTLAAYPTRTSLWMYYGNGAATAAQNAAASWDTTFRKVVNFSGTLGAAPAHGAGLISSVGATVTANNSGAGMSYVSGSTGTAIALDGTDDFIDIGADVGLNVGANAPFTAAVSVKTTDASGPIMAFRDIATGIQIIGIHVGYNGVTTETGKINVLVRDVTNGLYATIVGPVVNDNAWHQVVLSRNAGNVISLYVDGVSYGTATSAGSGGAITTDSRSLGSDRYWVANSQTTADNRFLSGAVDEMRFADTQLYSDWISANFSASQNTLSIFQAEETVTQGKAIITAQLNSSPAATVTVPYTVTGTASSGADFAALSGSLVIAAGNTTGTIDVNVLSDNIAEPSETVIITMGTPTGASLGTSKVHTVTITDDAPAPPVAVADTYNVTALTAAQPFAVLANDTDANGDLLTITSITAPTGGGTAVRSGTTILYTPSADFPASETFSYTITDGNGGSSSALVTVNLNIPFVWTGATSAAWATGTNWIGGVAPGASDIATFNNSCSTNCNPVIGANISIGGLRMNSSFGGTIAQPAGLTIAVNVGGWTQRAGTFVGGDSSIMMGIDQTVTSGDFNLLGGSFTAPGALMTVRGNFSVANTATFLPNGGALTLACTYGRICDVRPSTVTYNQVNFASHYGNFDLGGFVFKIAGAITAGDTYGVGYTGQLIRNGRIEASGDITVVNSGYRGNAIFELMGNASGQTVTGLADKFLPGLKISAGANPVTFIGDVGVGVGNYEFVSASSLTTTGSTLTLSCEYGVTCNIIPGANNYSNVTFAGAYTTYDLGGATMNVLGTLALGDRYGAGYTAQPINNGTFDVRGNVVFNYQGYRGSAVINAIGASNSTLSYTALAGTPTGTFTLNKDTTANTLSLTSAFNMISAGQNFTATRGTLNLAGFNMTVPGTMTVGADAKILCNGGLLTAGTSVVTGEISCGSSVGISWTGATGDGLWSTAGNWTNNTVPGATDVAIFSGQCAGANCNATFNTNLSVRGISLTAAYGGTLTQGTGRTLTIGAAGFSQAGGNFIGADANITASGPVSLSGGSFTATSATLQISGAYTVSGTPTFNANSGTLAFVATSAIAPGALNYANVTITGFNFISTITGTFTVNGLLTISDGSGGLLNGGTIEAKGDVSVLQNGRGGTTLLKIAGNSNQLITGATVSRIPSLEIASGGGTVTFAGTLTLRGSYTHTSGVVDAGTSTLIFAGSSTTFALIPGTTNFNAVNFASYSGVYTLTGTMTVIGELTMSDTNNGQINTGTIEAKGNVTFGSQGFLGTGKLRVAGNTDQLLTGAATSRILNFELANTGGTVTYAGTLYFANGYKYVSGVLDAGTSTVILYASSGVTAAITAGTAQYNNVTFDGYQGTLNLLDTIEVAGLTTIRGQTTSPVNVINTGTILARGNVLGSSQGSNGTAILKIAGNADQSMTTTGSRLPAIEFASTGGTVTVSGTFTVRHNFTYTSGVVDMTTSTIQLDPNVNTTFTPGSLPFYNLNIYGYWTTMTMTGTATTSGALQFLSSSGSPAAIISGGAFNAKGNLVYGSYGMNGTSTTTMSGSSSANLTIDPNRLRLTGAFTVDKSGGTSVTLLANAPLSAAGQALTIANGTLDLNGNTLNVAGALTIASGAQLKCNGGLYTSGSFSNSGTLNCPGESTYDFNWTGAGGDTNWTNASNWQGAIAPSATTHAYFSNAYCGSTCNATFNSAIGVRGITMASDYTGTITQGTGIAMAFGSAGHTQLSGNFVGSSAAMTFGSPLLVSGGSFTAPTGTMTFTGTTFNFLSTATFVHNGGSIVNSATWNSSARTYDLGGHTYNNLSFTGNGSYALGSLPSTVAGTLSINIGGYVSQLQGQLNSTGNVTVLNHEYGPRFTLRLTGAGNQTITTSGAAESGSTNVGRLVVDKSGGTAAVTGNMTIFGIQHVSGNFTVPAGLKTVIGHYVGSGSCWDLDTIVPGPIAFENVDIKGCGPRSITGTMTVNGNLSIGVGGNAAGIRNGKIQVKGDYSLSDENYSSSTDIEMIGTNDATITMTAGHINPGNLIIAKTGAGKVSLSSNVIVRNFNSGVQINSGTLDMLGRNLTIGSASGTNNQLTLQSGTVINRAGGTLTYEQLNNNGGTIN